MIITKTTAKKLIKAGTAREAGEMNTQGWGSPCGKVYVIVERLDLQRVDHYAK